MREDEVPPVPVGPQFPGAGGLIRLQIPIDGRNTKLSVLKGTKIDNDVGDVVAHVAGLLVAGQKYPLFEDQTRKCWVREVRSGFLKIDFDQLTIICASTMKGQQRDRLLQALLNSYRLSQIQARDSMFSFIPIVKAGLFHDVIYYIESPSLPEVVFPDLVMDSLRLVQFLIAGPDSPCGIDDPATYIKSLTKGEDPGKCIAFEPFFRSLLAEMSNEQARQFIMQVGEQLQLMITENNN